MTEPEHQEDFDKYLIGVRARQISVDYFASVRFKIIVQ